MTKTVVIDVTDTLTEPFGAAERENRPPSFDQKTAWMQQALFYLQEKGLFRDDHREHGSYLAQRLRSSGELILQEWRSAELLLQEYRDDVGTLPT